MYRPGRYRSLKRHVDDVLMQQQGGACRIAGSDGFGGDICCPHLFPACHVQTDQLSAAQIDSLPGIGGDGHGHHGARWCLPGCFARGRIHRPEQAAFASPKRAQRIVLPLLNIRRAGDKQDVARQQHRLDANGHTIAPFPELRRDVLGRRQVVGRQFGRAVPHEERIALKGWGLGETEDE